MLSEVGDPIPTFSSRVCSSVPRQVLFFPDGVIPKQDGRSGNNETNKIYFFFYIGFGSSITTMMRGHYLYILSVKRSKVRKFQIT